MMRSFPSSRMPQFRFQLKLLFCLSDIKSEYAAMDREKVKEIVSILMESPLYFDLPLMERMELIRRLMLMVHFV
jgi:hypothetical protein